ncbi:MAG: methylmalonyl-CoA epimerase [Planctomycetes bacterium]|nr:methylmalonyl-CoA epimerase [Planctomycetota bacterium]
MTTPPAVLAPIVRGLHHVAIVVESIAKSRGAYEQALGLASSPIEHVADQKVNVLVLYAGTQRIELVEPASPDSPVTNFLAKRGGGLHHLAWKVDDVAAAIARLEALNVRLIDRAPRPGAHHTRIAFVHPSATGGVLMELVEEPRDHPPAR